MRDHKLKRPQAAVGHKSIGKSGLVEQLQPLACGGEFGLELCVAAV